MNTSIILIILSMFLGLIGTFTETSEKLKNGIKRTTRWGYLVAALLILSAVISLVSESLSEKKRRIAYEKQQAEIQQQRLLSLLAVSANFDLSNQPFLLLTFLEDYSLESQSGQSVNSLNYHQFPGFGIDKVSYELNLAFNDNRQVVVSGDSLPMDLFTEDTDSVEQDQQSGSDSSFAMHQNGEFGIKFIYEPINNEINYLWELAGYQSLSELLIDLKYGSEIGNITFRKKSGTFSVNDQKKIAELVSKTGDWSFRMYIKSEKAENNLLHIAIPVKVSLIQKSAEEISFVLITGEPVLDNYPFSPV